MPRFTLVCRERFYVETTYKDVEAATEEEAIEQVKAASQRHGKACGLLVNDGAAAAQRLEQGWSFVGIGSDMTLLANAVAAEFGRART